LVSIYNSHPEYKYACLVRTKDKGDVVQKAFPNARIVIGNLDDSALLEEESARADVVLRKYLLDPQAHGGDVLERRLM